MINRHKIKFFKTALVFYVFSGLLWAGPFDPVLGAVEGTKLPWEYEMQGEQNMLSCTLEETTIKDKLLEIAIKQAKKRLNLPEVDGLCKTMNNNDIISQVINLLMEDFEPTYDFVGTFIGKDNAGSIFDLGGFAQCNIDLPKLKDTALARFCKDPFGKKDPDAKFSLSPIAALTTLTIDAAGLPSFAGKEDKEADAKPKKVAKREYLSGKTGKELFEEDGGILLKEAKEDPYGSTAKAFNTFDKATIVLKTLAAANMKDGDIGKIRLPETKAASMDLEDEVVSTQIRMTADLNQFGDTLTRAIQNKLVKIDMDDGREKKGIAPHIMSLARYAQVEKEVAKDIFKSKKSGLSAIYKGIEDEVKARMASEMLLMTADPNYIADPSEARAELIKPSQRNKFRYAALIQQEKNKMLKLKYALELKRKQQMVDIVKKQAQIRASIFRASAAKHELEHVLTKIDDAVKPK